MEHELSRRMMARIADGLKTKSLSTCSRWSHEHIRMGKPFPGPIDFEHHPWQREMHDSKASVNVGQKSAQMGYSTYAIDFVFYNMDVKKVNCLYLLPTKTPDATDFSADRFDAALEASEYLMNLFVATKNVAMKRTADATLWIRGMNSRSSLKSIDPAIIVFDELDEMDPEKIPLAEERTAGQLEKFFIKISTPTVPDFGINAEMLTSTNEHYFFNCPHGNHRIELTWPDCFKVVGESLIDPNLSKSHIICPTCKLELPHGPNGLAKQDWLLGGDPKWEPTNLTADPDKRGFYINQLYSPTVTPKEIAEWYFRSLVDPFAEQQLMNSKMGLPHIVAGGRVSDDQIQAAIQKGGGWSMDHAPPDNAFITMGVDIGKWLHFCVCCWYFTKFANDLNLMAECRILEVGQVPDFSDLDKLMMTYRPVMTVVDSEPESRSAYEFATRFWGRVKLCKYTRGHTDRMIKVSADGASHYITLDRTVWLDASMSRYKTGRIMLPVNTPFDFAKHVKALVKRYKEDKQGNPVAEYLKTGPDHYAHAQNYAEIALPIGASYHTNEDIEKFL